MALGKLSQAISDAIDIRKFENPYTWVKFWKT